MTQLPEGEGKNSQASPTRRKQKAGSLELRLVTATFIAMTVSVLLCGSLGFWDAREGVKTELMVAMRNGENAARKAVQKGLESGDMAAELSRLIETYQGGRHLGIRVVGADGQVRMRADARLRGPQPPEWFIPIFDPHTPSRAFDIPGAPGGYTHIDLVPAPRAEIGERWIGFRDTVLGVFMFLVLGLFLIHRTAGLVLRPLAQVRAALARIGGGDYRARVPVGHATELDELAQGLNVMAGQLEQVAAENRRLQEQLLTLQEEERAEIARDLHDEVGPYLFAVGIDAAAIGERARSAGDVETAGRVELIREAVAHMQEQVRDMLGRLRPVRLVEFGLRSALDDLISFWRARQPEIAFELDLTIPEGALSLEQSEAVYRLVQESLTNAVRHGQPSRVQVSAAGPKDGLVRLSVTNDGGRSAVHGAPSYGLLGMRERIAALGGQVSVDHESGQGWRVVAQLPCQSPVLSSVLESAS